MFGIKRKLSAARAGSIYAIVLSSERVSVGRDVRRGNSCKYPSNHTNNCCSSVHCKGINYGCC